MATAVKQGGSGAGKPQHKEPSFLVKAYHYVREAWLETKRATWPSWMDIRRLTTAVFVIVAIVSVYIFVLDVVLSMLTRNLIRN